jgi:hypothetical protein
MNQNLGTLSLRSMGPDNTKVLSNDRDFSFRQTTPQITRSPQMANAQHVQVGEISEIPEAVPSRPFAVWAPSSKIGEGQASVSDWADEGKGGA